MGWDPPAPTPVPAAPAPPIQPTCHDDVDYCDDAAAASGPTIGPLPNPLVVSFSILSDPTTITNPFAGTTLTGGEVGHGTTTITGTATFTGNTLTVQVAVVFTAESMPSNIAVILTAEVKVEGKTPPPVALNRPSGPFVAPPKSKVVEGSLQVTGVTPGSGATLEIRIGAFKDCIYCINEMLNKVVKPSVWVVDLRTGEIRRREL